MENKTYDNDYYSDCNRVIVFTPSGNMDLEIASVKKHGRNYEFITKEGQKVVANEKLVILFK